MTSDSVQTAPGLGQRFMLFLVQHAHIVPGGTIREWENSAGVTF